MFSPHYFRLFDCGGQNPHGAGKPPNGNRCGYCDVWPKHCHDAPIHIAKALDGHAVAAANRGRDQTNIDHTGQYRKQETECVNP